MPEIDAVDRQIIDQLQGEFPLCEHPYAVAAKRLGIAPTPADAASGAARAAPKRK